MEFQTTDRQCPSARSSTQDWAQDVHSDGNWQSRPRPMDRSTSQNPRRTRAAPPGSNVTASVVGGPRRVRPSGNPPHPQAVPTCRHGGRWPRCTGCATGWIYRPVDSRDQTTVHMAANPTPRQGQPPWLRTAALVSPCPLCSPASGQTGVAPIGSPGGRNTSAAARQGTGAGTDRRRNHGRAVGMIARAVIGLDGQGGLWVIQIGKAASAAGLVQCNGNPMPRAPAMDCGRNL